MKLTNMVLESWQTRDQYRRLLIRMMDMTMMVATVHVAMLVFV